MVAAVTGAHAQTVLVVDTEPSGGTVFVDGQLAGRAPVTVPVAPGRHDVTVEAEGFRPPPPQEVAVASGDTARVVVRLERQTGQVRVEGIPEGSEVQTPGWALTGVTNEVPVGVTMLLVQTPEGDELEARLVVREGRETWVRYQPCSFEVSAFLSNAFAPGSVQARNGRRGAGLVYGVGVGAGLAGVAATTVLAVVSDGDRSDALRAYEAATTEADAVALWPAVEDAHARGTRWRSARTVALASAAVVYVAAFVDGAVFHGSQPSLEVSTRAVQAAWEVGAGADGVALRYRF